VADHLQPYEALLDVCSRQLQAVAADDWDTYLELEPERIFAFGQLPDRPAAEARPLIEQIAGVTDALKATVAARHSGLRAELGHARQASERAQAYSADQTPLITTDLDA
jgi:hypothetical protein